MARRTLPTFSVLWRRHEQLYINLFSEALLSLASISNLPADEDAISEKLSLLLGNICFERFRESNEEIRRPDWEKPIPPDSEEALKGGKKRKRPDFTCSLINTLATSAEDFEVPYHVECKRLGKKVGSWNLTKNYVTNGIHRYDNSEHEYGKGAPSGLMIGFVESGILPSDTQVEINQHVNELIPSAEDLTLEFTSQVNLARQKLLRSFVKPTQFELSHLWVNFK